MPKQTKRKNKVKPVPFSLTDAERAEYAARFPGIVFMDDPAFLDGFNVRPLLDALIADQLKASAAATDKPPETGEQSE